jgi:hypothetical protein
MMRFAWVRLIILLAPIAGTVFLQIFLSKRDNKWFGLILPILSLCLSLLVIFGMTIFDPAVNMIITAGVSLLLCNIPTAILLVIYFACRETLKKRRELEKMNVQDLG